MNKNYKRDNKGDFDQKMIDIRRVARVMAGGRRFNFRVTVIAGNRNGEVGVGMGKASDTASAIEKAFRQAKKNIIKVKLTKNFSVSSDTKAKFASSRIVLRPAPEGHGLVAGSSLRTVLDLAGVKNATAKILTRSKNKVNIARAAI
ncbi:MAG: 30S ribosomal protein S5, partial [Candidatus Parcubacteria bacterium]|nr:30S ribosomal protein S5 [Candidatus Parcubacteria bacterium]